MTVPTKPKPTLLQEAIAKGASVEIVERLMAMQERWEANEARRAFNAAIAAFKSNPPEILKTVAVGYDSRRTGERTSYKYEDLAEILAAVDPALAKHGLWVRFRISSAPNIVTVTCVLGHADGHSEEPATLQGSPDTSGNKNAIQAIGSTVSYLQRYTLKAALGMAAARDDDGRASGKPVQENIPPQTERVLPHRMEVKVLADGKSDWFTWGKALAANIRSEQTFSEGAKWLELNKAGIQQCHKDNPDIYIRLGAAVRASGYELPQP